ncbi:hypothetical protein PHSY_000270 [Pseudozyma hubeiensis SY62]|uniref:Peptidase S9 prolyl oligopeptidase catalytic domain-containing protein n=1 Tax=Pseudozyma hubeiensis (strain SY62) TaxID=1305764 RepID=R9P3N7_PSEHS|nr:hypothetical protein PHSY_000270 [Pseudozyma hubeiensis SY62]GAC92715.1 hypothetical protein PHSY_000270 [Pseudozyma hubeiensis SY62]
MRELPFGGFPASATAFYPGLLNTNFGSNRHFSTYGPTNATTLLQSFEASVQSQSSERVRHSLTVEYPNVDWPWVRKSAGWSSLQWQMIAATDLDIEQNSTALAITMDKTAEFAMVRKDSFSVNATVPGAIEWHTGDWYSYIAAFAKEDEPLVGLPISHHLVHLDRGLYKLLVRSQYEIRIFGDPRNSGGAESPKMTIGIDIAARGLQNAKQQDMVEAHTDPHHSNVPHIVGGWMAGWGLSFGIRSISPNETYILHSVNLSDDSPDAVRTGLKAELGSTLTMSPSQTVAVPVRISQTAPIDSSLSSLVLNVSLTTISAPAEVKLTKSVRIPLVHKMAFWQAASDEQDHHAYMFSYLADDGTVQMAAATPPKQTNAALDAPLPPLILTLHGAGVDVRDLFFSNSIRRQDESWVILPTGRTPWGYDWQLTSLEAADAAVSAFHKHLYGLPPTMTSAEKQVWQFDPEKLFVMGHSNGGQGAWYRLSRFPDRAIGGMVGSAYTKVSDYVSFAWKIGRHYIDPALQGILHSGVTMFENDLYASNLAGLDLLVKFGSADANVPPWNPKDMAMVVDGWNRRSGLVDKLKISEVAGRPHWWDTLFSEDDVQAAIEAACLSTRNVDYRMPAVPQTFTLTVFNPAEAGSKGGWRICEVDNPGRLAKLEVRYAQTNEADAANVHVVARNARRFELDLTTARRTSDGVVESTFWNATSLHVSINGQMQQADISNVERVQFVLQQNGKWAGYAGDISGLTSKPARPIGPLLRIVSTKGPMLLIVPSSGPQFEVKAWFKVAQRFAADLLLYGAINSQILTDGEFASSASEKSWKQSNMVTFGGPKINLFTRSIFDRWPTQSSIHFPSARTSAQFRIQDRLFYENGTALVTLAPHPTYDEGLALVVHGIGAEGISRAARLLPTRTATMIPEWVVTDNTAEWMGEGGVQAAGWYDHEWGWSERMSYVQ